MYICEHLTTVYHPWKKWENIESCMYHRNKPLVNKDVSKTADKNDNNASN